MESVPMIDESLDASVDCSASARMSAAFGLSPVHEGPRLSAAATPGAFNINITSAGSKRACGPKIVVYHNISATEHVLTRGLGVTTDPDLFRRHVRYFAKNFDLIAPTDLLTGVLPRRPLLITFDDVYRSVVDIAGPILKEVSASSIWFLNPASIVEQSLPMDNLLAFAASCAEGRGRLAQLGLRSGPNRPVSKTISECLPDLSYDQAALVSAALAELCPHSEASLRHASALFLTPDDLNRLAEYNIEIGNHSTNHRFLRTLSSSQLELEIAQSRQMLERLSGQKVRFFAVPYGHELDATQHVLDVARLSGHEATFLVHARSNVRRPPNNVYYRIGPENVRTYFLPLVLNLLPRLRSGWKSLH